MTRKKWRQTLYDIFISYLVPVPIRRNASVGDAHAEASYASKLICRGQIKGIRLTLVASETRCVLLKKKMLENCWPFIFIVNIDTYVYIEVYIERV